MQAMADSLRGQLAAENAAAGAARQEVAGAQAAATHAAAEAEAARQDHRTARAALEGLTAEAEALRGEVAALDDLRRAP